ncbi:MAG: hypothetical protein K2H83_09245, partial [Duncaniella sp.]|nr:hypothetical protein [Duncaniella sp.]
MKQIISLAALMAAASLNAAPLMVCDFESFEIGTQWTLWTQGGGQPASTATVVADPANPSNKVLHIRLKDWGCHPEFALTTELLCKDLTERFKKENYYI